MEDCKSVKERIENLEEFVKTAPTDYLRNTGELTIERIRLFEKKRTEEMRKALPILKDGLKPAAKDWELK